MIAPALTGKAPLRSETVKGNLLTIARNLHLASLQRRKRRAALPPDLADSAPQADHLILGTSAGLLGSTAPMTWTSTTRPDEWKPQ
jgi:DNA-directed RNA polymerase specialized sigma24 family protein